MTDAAFVALDSRVTALENTIPGGLKRIEDLIHNEIHDLKTEQLGDIKTSIKRAEDDTKATLARIEHDAQKAIDRIADDQRRLWESVRNLEGRENQRYGGDKRANTIWNFVSAMAGAGLAIFAEWFSRKP